MKAQEIFTKIRDKESSQNFGDDSEEDIIQDATPEEDEEILISTPHSQLENISISPGSDFTAQPPITPVRGKRLLEEEKKSKNSRVVKSRMDLSQNIKDATTSVQEANNSSMMMLMMEMTIVC